MVACFCKTATCKGVACVKGWAEAALCLGDLGPTFSNEQLLSHLSFLGSKAHMESTRAPCSNIVFATPASPANAAQ